MDRKNVTVLSGVTIGKARSMDGIGRQKDIPAYSIAVGACRRM
jgi:acetyltransferase-like isoleucine patch superfamily enzyme